MQEKEAGNRGLHITAADYEYSTLMQLMGVSVSKHLLDEHYTVVWANEFYYELIGWPKGRAAIACCHVYAEGTVISSGYNFPPSLRRNILMAARWHIPCLPMWMIW